jgi:hypothetical protein
MHTLSHCSNPAGSDRHRRAQVERGWADFGFRADDVVLVVAAPNATFRVAGTTSKVG